MRNSGLIGGMTVQQASEEPAQEQNHVAALMWALRDLERAVLFAEDVLSTLTNGPRQINAANKPTDKVADPCLAEMLNHTPETISNQARRIEGAIEQMKQVLRL